MKTPYFLCNSLQKEVSKTKRAEVATNELSALNIVEPQEGPSMSVTRQYGESTPIIKLNFRGWWS